MKKFIAATLVVLSAFMSFASQAVVNRWTESYQQGTLEFYTESTDGYSLAFSCRDTGDNWPDQALFLTDAKGQSLSTTDDRYTLVIDIAGDTYQMITPLSRVGSSNWRAFFDTVKVTKAKNFKLYVEGHPDAYVIFSTNGLKKLVAENKGGKCFYLD